MLICNCTLPYTNPEACKSCSSYLKEYTGMAYDWNDWLKDWNKYTYPVTLTWNYGFDENRYELVEKKDWKINNLKQQIEKKLKLYEEKHAQAVELKEDLELLEKELKELETNNE